MKTAVWRVPGLVSAGGGNLKSNYICEDIPQSLMGFGDGEHCICLFFIRKSGFD